MNTKKIVKIAALSAIAALLQHMAWFFPKVGGFLDIEISDFPAIIASFAMGPLAGILTELIKNILHLPFTTTGYVGEFANFAVNGIFVLVSGLIYSYNFHFSRCDKYCISLGVKKRREKTKKGAIAALLCSTVFMTAAAMLTNRFIMLPLFNLPPQTYWPTVFLFITPFNFARGAVLSLLTFVSYKKLRTLLK